jgi:hypothetical protein
MASSIWAKAPEDHVAGVVRATAVEEHCRYDRDPVMAGNNLGGDRRPVGDKCLPTHKLERENESVREDNDNCYDRDAHRASRGVTEGDQGSHSVFLHQSVQEVPVIPLLRICNGVVSVSSYMGSTIRPKHFSSQNV